MPSTENVPSYLTKALAEALKETLDMAKLYVPAPLSAPGFKRAREALAAYAASQADPADVPAVAPALNAWNWLAKHRDAELSYRLYAWEVRQTRGAVDRYKRIVISAGPTPLEAVLAAMAAAGGE